MIPIARVSAPPRTDTLLAKWTAGVRAAGATPEAAREHWGRAAAPKRHVRSLLEQMAHGGVRCMYCDDSRGTDIDHFQPLATAPLLGFVWANHLLACAFCNSNAKRDRYPLDAAGACLLVDPTSEDPAEHLRLLLRSGAYDALTRKGEESIDVFGLNRPELVMGRQDAFFRACSNLRDWHLLLREEDPDADRLARALLNSPFVDVVCAMTRLRPELARTVVGERTAPALQAWRAHHGA